MSQTIALQAKSPQVSLAEVMDNVQRARVNELKINQMGRDEQLDTITTGQKIDEANAIGRYRTRAGAKDPGAMDELNAYPETQKKLFDAFDGMSPEEYMQAKKRSRAFGEAARRVMAFGEGTPQQVQAWNEQMDGLKAGGFIDAKTADAMKQQGPNKALLNEAMEVEEFVNLYSGKGKGKNNPEKDALEVEKLGLEVDETKRKNSPQARAQARLDKYKQGLLRDNDLTADDRAAMIEAEKMEIWAEEGLDQAPADPEAPGKKSSAEGTQENPVDLSALDDAAVRKAVSKLPKGSHFKLKDGRTGVRK